MPRSVTVRLRITTTEKQQWTRSATARGLTLSEFIRQAIVGPPAPSRRLCPKCAPFGKPLPLCPICKEK